MGNKQGSSAVLPSYENALGILKTTELEQVKSNFRALSDGRDQFTSECLSKFLSVNAHYIRKHIIPRLFVCLDYKKDGLLDLEEYVSIVVLLRSGSWEERAKFLINMYEGSKNGGCLSKDSLRQLLVDATICVQKQQVSLQQLEESLTNIRQLSDALVESAMYQYSSSSNKMDAADFTTFLKVEGTLQSMLSMLSIFLNDKRS